MGMRQDSDRTIYFIEYKGNQIELGSSWKDAIHSIDKNFGKNDLMLNLALKINVWNELKNNKNFLVPK